MAYRAIPRGDGTPKAWSERLYTRFRRAWFQSRSVDVALIIGWDSSEPNTDEARYGADNIALKLNFRGRSVWWNLTHHTEAELLGLKTIFDTAFDVAIPVARSLDNCVQAELESGAEDVSPRAFRLSPMLVVREVSARPANPDNIKEKKNESTIDPDAGCTVVTGDDPSE